MSIFKCKMCGGTLEVNSNETVATCEYCGTQQTLPKLDDDRRANLYDRANHFRRNNEFDKAMGIYEQILNEDNTDAEAYWSLVLCRYGIEYVEDSSSHKRIPTVNRAQFTSIFDDDNYKSALQYADGYQRNIYVEEAKAINEIQKGILAISQREEPFDVFICYKETDNIGRRTPDSVLANDLYHQLTQEGFKVFFARITLEDKLGSAYEPYIFAALNSAKVMVVLGTKPEFFNAVWVKNEWSRYLALIKQGQKKMLIPAYKDMDPYDLPEEFAHLQAQDMSKLGFMQDLIRGIKKIVKADEPKQTMVKETVVTTGVANAAPLLRRAFIFLEDADWKSADEYCEKVLDIDPENAFAYLGKLMAELKVKSQESLKHCAEPFDKSSNYQKVVRFADEKLKAELSGYIEHINVRNEKAREKARLDREKARLDGIYSRAKKAMSVAVTENDFKEAAHLFETISDYEDSAVLAQECYDKAEVARKDAIFNNGKSKMNGKTVSNYEAAIKIFEAIPGWRNVDEQIYYCQKRIEEINTIEEARRLEQKRQAEIARKEAKRRAKRNKMVAVLTVCAVIALYVVINTVIPNYKYNHAIALMDAGEYTEALSIFEALDGYKDSNTKITECNTAIIDGKYNDAIALMDAGEYTEALSILEPIILYKDSINKIKECKYNNAIALMDAGKYTEAISAFEALHGYKDSFNHIQECKYNDAIALMDAGKYTEALSILRALDGYKDSTEKAYPIEVEKLKNAKVGDYVFFGAYEQDNNTSNGKEAVEWLVLDIKDSKVLVISRYALDRKPYNTSDAAVTWETCTLRKWLNNDFINTAFTAEEKALIPTVTVSTDWNRNTDSGKATQDRVFLLSIYEVNNFFSSDVKRRCKPTNDAVDYGIFCKWWLRSPGNDQNHAATVDSDGDVWKYGWVDFNYAVRPALWIDLNS